MLQTPSTTTAAAPEPWLSGWKLSLIRGLALTAVVGVALLLTYDRCIGCVVAIAIFAALTMNCVPLMPLVFLLSMLVLVMHAIDYQRASIRVEVPLQDVIYVPTWDDVAKYVKLAPSATT